MATIKSFTSIEQSKKLAKILPLESADMVYFGIHQGMDGKYYLSGTNTEDDVVPIYKNLCTKVFVKTTTSDIICQLPCWSLTALLDVLPNNEHIATTLSRGGWKIEPVEYIDEWFCEYEDDVYDKNFTVSADNPVDACYEMILKLHELDLV